MRLFKRQLLLPISMMSQWCATLSGMTVDLGPIGECKIGRDEVRGARGA